MTIIAEVVRSGTLASVARVKLAAAPAAGDSVYLGNSHYIVSSVGHFPVEIDSGSPSIADGIGGEPYIVVAVD